MFRLPYLCIWTSCVPLFQGVKLDAYRALLDAAAISFSPFHNLHSIKRHAHAVTLSQISTLTHSCWLVTFLRCGPAHRDSLHVVVVNHPRATTSSPLPNHLFAFIDRPPSGISLPAVEVLPSMRFLVTRLPGWGGTSGIAFNSSEVSEGGRGGAEVLVALGPSFGRKRSIGWPQ
jgi:hypothetical protein